MSSLDVEIRNLTRDMEQMAREIQQLKLWKLQVGDGAGLNPLALTGPPAVSIGAGSWPLMNPATELTIASGAITVTQDHHIVRTEAAAASDYLDTINGGVANKWLVVRSNPTSNGGGETISIVDSGNIIPLNKTFSSEVLNITAGQYALLWYQPDDAKWYAFVPGQRDDAIFEDTLNYGAVAGLGFLRIQGLLVQQDADVTISSGKLTSVAANLLRVDTEGGASSDDLVSIEVLGAFASGDLCLMPKDDTHTIVLKHDDGSGTTGFKLFCQGGVDITLDDLSHCALLVYNQSLDSGSGGWMAGLVGGGAETCIEVPMGDGISTFATGVRAYMEVPYSGTVIGWALVSDVAATLTVDVWVDIYANFPPTIADTITGTDTPKLTAAITARNLGPLTNWGNVVLVKGDWLVINVAANDVAKRATLSLRVVRSD